MPCRQIGHRTGQRGRPCLKSKTPARPPATRNKTPSGPLGGPREVGSEGRGGEADHRRQSGLPPEDRAPRAPQAEGQEERRDQREHAPRRHHVAGGVADPPGEVVQERELEPRPAVGLAAVVDPRPEKRRRSRQSFRATISPSVSRQACAPEGGAESVGSERPSQTATQHSASALRAVGLPGTARVMAGAALPPGAPAAGPCPVTACAGRR